MLANHHCYTYNNSTSAPAPEKCRFSDSVLKETAMVGSCRFL